MPPTSEAKKRANKKWADKHYENVNIRFPKGTKDKIKATGESVNGFVNKAVAERLENFE